MIMFKLFVKFLDIMRKGKLNIDDIATMYTIHMLKSLREAYGDYDINLKNQLAADEKLVKIQRTIIQKMDEKTLEIHRYIENEMGRGMSQKGGPDKPGATGGEMAESEEMSEELGYEVFTPGEFEERLGNMLKLLNEKEKELRKLEQQIKEKESGLVMREESIMQREAELKKRERALKEREMRLREMMKNLGLDNEREIGD